MERDLFYRLIQGGATFKAILSPPVDAYKTSFGWLTHLDARYRRLISILDGRSKDPRDKLLAMNNVRLVLSPFRGNNLIIFDDRLLYEGIKSSIQGGFDLTARTTHKSLVSAHVKAFDRLYKDSEEFTLSKFGARHRKNRSSAIRAAVLSGLKNAHQRYWENVRSV